MTDGTVPPPLTLKEEAIEVLTEWYDQLALEQRDNPSEMNGQVLRDVLNVLNALKAI